MPRVLLALEIISAGTARIGAAEKLAWWHGLATVETLAAWPQSKAARLELAVLQRRFAKAFLGVGCQVVEAHGVSAAP